MRQQVFDRSWAAWMADTVLEKFPVLREKWSYDQSVVSKGLEMVWEVTGEEQYYDYIRQNMDRFVGEDGSIPLYARDGSYDYYISEPRQKNHLHGIGAFMMAASEIERLKTKA